MDIITEIHHKLKEQYSPATVVSYLPKIQQYITWLKQHCNITESTLNTTTKADVSAWLDTLSPTTVSSHNLALNAVMAMYRLTEHSIELSDLRRYDSNHPSVEWVKESEALQIISTVRSPYNIILSLMYYHGLTVQRVLGLRVGDEDSLDVDMFLGSALSGWIRQKELVAGDLLFPGRRTNLSGVVSAAVNRLNLSKYINTTSFRIGGAVRLWQSGATDDEVREWLQSSPSTLFRYKRYFSKLEK